MDKSNPSAFINCDVFVRLNKMLDKPIIWDVGVSDDGNGSKELVYVFTDGACTSNGKVGCVCSYAYVIVHNNNVVLSGSGLVNGELQSNNRGELTAVIMGMKAAITRGVVGDHVIVTDSNYCIGSLSKWYNTWVKEGIVHKKKNIDLIEEAMKMIEKFTFKHVNSHRPKPVEEDKWFFWYYNDMVDKMATKIIETHQQP
jgi:ribonuclease HI